MHGRLTAAAIAAICLVVALAEPVHSAFTARTSVASDFAAAALFAPRDVAAPAVSGAARVGQALTATAGVWVRGTVGTSVQWQRCSPACSDIAGETSTTYVVADTDVGTALRVTVTAENDAGSRVAVSQPTAVVPGAPVAGGSPAITGALVIGDVLTAEPGTWSGEPTFSFRWLRCTTACTEVDDGRTHLLTSEDAGATLRVEVTARNDAGQTTAISAPTAPVGRGTYTHVLCAHPGTGLGTGTDGAIQDGTDFEYLHAAMGAAINDARCAKGVAQTMARGIPITTGTAFATSTPSFGTALKYRAPAGIEFTGALLYRKVALTRHGSGAWDTAVHRSATVRWLFGTPFDERCLAAMGCSGHGIGATPFSALNGMGIGGAAGANGFNVALLCNIPDSSRTCVADGTETYRLFGGKVSLRDPSAPVLDAASGSLLTATTLAPRASLTLSARDAGAGLYRVRVRLGDTEVAARVLGGESCRDAAPGVDDDYEFATQRPCPASVATTLDFDTTTWPRGEHVLRVLLEDAGRNVVTVQRRTVTL